jgi:hypothetical protein
MLTNQSTTQRNHYCRHLVWFGTCIVIRAGGTVQLPRAIPTELQPAVDYRNRNAVCFSYRHVARCAIQWLAFATEARPLLADHLLYLCRPIVVDRAQDHLLSLSWVVRHVLSCVLGALYRRATFV